MKQRIKPEQEWQRSKPIRDFGSPVVSRDDWSATRQDAKATLDRLEAENDRITRAFLLASTPGIAKKIQAEALRVEAELARTRAGRTRLRDGVRELFAATYAQSRRLGKARDESTVRRPRGVLSSIATW